MIESSSTPVDPPVDRLTPIEALDQFIKQQEYLLESAYSARERLGLSHDG